MGHSEVVPNTNLETVEIFRTDLRESTVQDLVPGTYAREFDREIDASNTNPRWGAHPRRLLMLMQLKQLKAIASGLPPAPTLVMGVTYR